ALVRAGDVASDDDLVESGLEKFSGRHLDSLTNLKRLRGDSTNLNVGVGPAGLQGEGRDDDDLWAEERAVATALDSGSILYNVNLIERDGRHHFRGCTGTGDDRVGW